MQHDEVGVRLLGADGHVVPDQVVVVQLLLQALAEAALALRHAGNAGADRGDECGHEVARVRARNVWKEMREVGAFGRTFEAARLGRCQLVPPRSSRGRSDAHLVALASLLLLSRHGATVRIAVVGCLGAGMVWDEAAREAPPVLALMSTHHSSAVGIVCATVGRSTCLALRANRYLARCALRRGSGMDAGQTLTNTCKAASTLPAP